MQSDRDALLAGILADPDADLPRLVFADWLEETGHPANCARAEYIRLAIERADFKPRGRVMPRHMKRLGALRGMFADEWDTLLAANAEIQNVRVGYRRGFVDDIATPVNLLIHMLAELSTILPAQHLTLTWPASFRRGPESATSDSVSSTHYAMSREGEGSRGLKLTSLKFDAIPGPESVLMFLLQDCDITRLKELSLPRCRLHDADLVRMLADAKPLLAASGLVVLDLSHNPLTDHAAHTLAASDWPPGFRRLNIDGTRISNAGREVLFRRFGFEELRPRLALS